MFDLLRENSIQIDDTLYAMAQQQELRKSKKVEGKVLEILPAASGEYDDKTITVTLQIKAKGLKNYNAKIMIGEFPNVLPDFGSALVSYKLSSDTITRVQIKFPSENFNLLKVLVRESKFIATVACDGLSAESEEFKINATPKPKKIVETIKKTCLCKKTSFTSEEIKNIVIGLRKGEILLKATDKDGKMRRDKEGHPQYYDSKNNSIPNDKNGNPTLKGGKKIYDDLTVYDDKDINNITITERLFFLRDIDENINAKESNYSEFTKWLNFAIKELFLNSCLRKIHFLAQIYQETQRFAKSYENTSSVYGGGNFYQGRGFLQLTHDYNYKAFYKSLYNKEADAIELKVFVPKVANSLEMAMRSAIWYWKKEKINQYADKDDLARVSAAINLQSMADDATINVGKINGYIERKKYYLILKNIFDYENCK